MRRPAHGAAALLAWILLLLATIAMVGATGTGALRPPPVGGGAGAVADWLAARTGVEAVFALFRLGVLALAWYLLGATGLGLLARMVRAPRLLAAADAVTMPHVRRLVQGAFGASVLAVAVSGAAAGAPRAAVPAGALVQAGSGEAEPVMTWLAYSGDAPVMTHLGDPPAGLLQPAEAAPAGDGRWPVAPGDHLWHIAEHVLSDAWGRPVTDAELTPYWSAVVEANRHRLADHTNPDLLLPGQVMTVPPPPAPPPAPR